MAAVNRPTNTATKEKVCLMVLLLYSNVDLIPVGHQQQASALWDILWLVLADPPAIRYRPYLR